MDHPVPTRQQIHPTFPVRAALARLVRFHLGENLATITDAPDLADVVFTLLEWADTHNRLPDLLAGAVAENQGNAEMRAPLPVATVRSRAIV